MEYNGEQLANQLRDGFHLEITEPGEQRDSGQDLDKSYNVAPTNMVNVYSIGHQLKSMKWGLVPSWIVHSKIDSFNSYRTINARLETLTSKRIWKKCVHYKRCVIPVSGYYEWQTKGKEKIPYYVRRKDGELTFLAGLYDSFDVVEEKKKEEESKQVKKEEKSGKLPLYTFTIITADAPKNLKWLHDRMPCILVPGTNQWDNWFNTEHTEWEQKELSELLEPIYDETTMDVYRVSKDVGKVSNKGEYLIKPVLKREGNGVKTEEEPVSIKKESGQKRSITDMLRSSTKRQKK